MNIEVSVILNAVERERWCFHYDLDSATLSNYYWAHEIALSELPEDHPDFESLQDTKYKYPDEWAKSFWPMMLNGHKQHYSYGTHTAAAQPDVPNFVVGRALDLVIDFVRDQSAFVYNTNLGWKKISPQHGMVAKPAGYEPQVVPCQKRDVQSN